MHDAQQPSLAARVEAVLDKHVRPELAELGGDVELIGIDADSIVQVRLLGNCSGCTSMTYQLTMLVESRLKTQIPEVRFVEALP